MEAYFSIASAVSSYAHKNRRRLADLIGTDYNKLMAGMQFHNAEQLLDWSMMLLDKLRSESETERQDSRTRLIADVRQFVEQHLEEDVSLPPSPSTSSCTRCIYPKFTRWKQGKT